MAGLVNVFAWSSSRVRHLRDCERLYYWHIYGSWSGWEDRAPAETREAYRLKKLQTRWAWTGDAVHHQLKREIALIQAGQPSELQPALAAMHHAMRAQWAHSRSSKRDRKLASGFWGLLEHEYGESIPDDEWKRMWVRAENAVRWWFESDFRRLILETPRDRWLAVDPERGEKLVSFPLLEGVPSYGAPDFALLTPEDRPQTLEWKTGLRKPADVDQVLNYALLLEHRKKRPAVGQLATIVYFREQDWDDVVVDAQALEDFRWRVQGDVELMRSKLKDPARNVPLPMEEFRQTSDVRRCARCYFRRLCKRDGVHGGPATEEEEDDT